MISEEFIVNCPVPIDSGPVVQMAHGGGGRLMHQLIDTVFAPALQRQTVTQLHDAAVIDFASGRLAFTTDSYVVRPLFFPGGDIGTLAVNGTVNDLAMAGARPLYLSASFILEEGYSIALLKRIVLSMRDAAAAAGVGIVTGDTKVVDKGKGDEVFINTAGVGRVDHALEIHPASVRPGDAVLLSGDIGRHGIAIMAAREGLAFETTIESDCTSLAELVMQLLQAGVEIHCLRDLTRGGLASALVEIAESSRQPVHIDESKLPVLEEVQGACEILGLDPLYVANEGRFIAFVPPKDEERALEVMHAHEHGVGGCRIGTVESRSPGRVTMKSRIGATRIVDMLSGEQLPRIC